MCALQLHTDSAVPKELRMPFMAPQAGRNLLIYTCTVRGCRDRVESHLPSGQQDMTHTGTDACVSTTKLVIAIADRGNIGATNPLREQRPIRYAENLNAMKVLLSWYRTPSGCSRGTPGC